MAIGEAIGIGNWKDISQRLETLKTITSRNIQQFCKEWLTEKKSTIVPMLQCWTIFKFIDTT